MQVTTRGRKVIFFYSFFFGYLSLTHRRLDHLQLSSVGLYIRGISRLPFIFGMSSAPAEKILGHHIDGDNVSNWGYVCLTGSLVVQDIVEWTTFLLITWLLYDLVSR
jgi:hypothetical protein